MNTKEKISLLEEWKQTYDKLEVAFKSLEQALGCDLVESDLYNASYESFEKYTAMLSKLFVVEGKITEQDVQEWLWWYWIENDMGASGLEASSKAGGKLKKIDTLQKLLHLIEG